ncbi:RNA-directed DNA polymerase, eukaryota [Tanacetum coccineum]
MSLNVQGLAQKAKKDWVKELCDKNKVNFIGLQETKMWSIDLSNVRSCWGNSNFDYVHSDSVGNSGGILCIWDPNSFRRSSFTRSDYFVIVRGVWLKSGIDLMIVVVYAPQEAKEKRMLWDYLAHVSNQWVDKLVMMVEFARCDTISLKMELRSCDEVIDKGDCSNEVVHKRTEILNKIHQVNNIQASKIAQKAKIKWAIEEDENVKFFHGMLNKKRNQYIIRGFMVNAEVRFDKPSVNRACIDTPFPVSLSIDPKEDMERMISKEEDFRPISLIGSLSTKIIAKILANRLVGVLGDLVNEVQSAFVADRQILDGPFILDEVKVGGLRFNVVLDHLGGFILLTVVLRQEFQFFRGLIRSKIIGVKVEDGSGKNAVLNLGVLSFKTPFNLFGYEVGGKYVMKTSLERSGGQCLRVNRLKTVETDRKRLKSAKSVKTVENGGGCGLPNEVVVDVASWKIMLEKKEKDEKLDGDAALNKFFRDIYSDADEDTRRAMSKSL